MLFNVFVNELLCFVLECKLYNYADDNTLSKVGSTLNMVKYVLESLIVAACNATKWLTEIFMNPDEG